MGEGNGHLWGHVQAIKRPTRLEITGLPPPKNGQEIHAAFEQSVRDAEECLTGMIEEKAQGKWRRMFKDKEIFTKPRIHVMRSILMNHWYHHRGQLSVYLRLLDVPVPMIYGRSADENPFG